MKDVVERSKHVTGCTGKRSFARFDQAARSAKRRNRKDGGAHLEAYHCTHCNQFHVGEAREYGRRRRPLIAPEFSAKLQSDFEAALFKATGPNPPPASRRKKTDAAVPRDNDTEEAMHNVQSPRTDDGAIEHEIQAKGKTAPRVTPATIEAVIASCWYFTAAQGAEGSDMPQDVQPPVPIDHPLHLLTFCVLVLRNGFTVTGESACASPENFDAEIGRKVAHANAVNKVWALEGYLLKQMLHSTPADFRDRVRAERAENEDRLDKLSAFLATPTFEKLPEAEQERLVRQSGVMVQLSDVLGERIAAF